MRQATLYGDHDRARLGLPDLATHEDRRNAVEISGEKTDMITVEASKHYGVPYSKVTSAQREFVEVSFYRETCF